LNRAIQKYLEDPIAEEILRGDLQEGDTILADFEEGKEELTLKNKKNSQPASDSKE
jgi:ATP-dependent Clp protease ATP-binding subunit ClpC